MDEFPEGSRPIRSVSGETYLVEHGTRQGSFFVEMANNILLNVFTNESIEILYKNEKGIYCYIADLCFHDNGGHMDMSLFSTAIQTASVRDQEEKSEIVGNITSMLIGFNHLASTRWHKRVKSNDS